MEIRMIGKVDNIPYKNLKINTMFIPLIKYHWDLKIISKIIRIFIKQ